MPEDFLSAKVDGALAQAQSLHLFREVPSGPVSIIERRSEACGGTAEVAPHRRRVKARIDPAGDTRRPHAITSGTVPDPRGEDLSAGRPPRRMQTGDMVLCEALT
jgi:hypothetical protein